MSLIRLAGLLALAASVLSAPLPAQQPRFELTPVGPDIYRFRWVGHHALVVVGPRGVVVVDPISREASLAMAGEIRRVAPGRPLAAVVYSHKDADHATGAPALMEALNPAPVIGQANGAAPLAARGDPDLPPPDIAFQDRMTTRLGGRTIELVATPPNHADDMLVALVPDAGIAFAVDFIANDRVGYRDLPGWDFDGQLASLALVLSLRFDRLVFGHGPDGDRASVQRQVAYWDDLRSLVAAAISQGLSEEEAAERVRAPQYAGWGQYEAWFPMNVRGMYRWLSSR